MNKLSIYDLIDYVFKLLPQQYKTVEVDKYLFDSFLVLQKNGWTSKEILQIINNHGGVLVKGVLDFNLLFGYVQHGENNLLQNKMYVHKELKILPPMSSLSYDIESGEIIKTEQEIFLEMRYDYTIDDLFNYCVSKKNFSNNIKKQKNKTYCGLRWLLNKFDVQEILYMIDCADDEIGVSNYSKLDNILLLQNYYEEANDKINIAYGNVKSNGIKIIRRKR